MTPQRRSLDFELNQWGRWIERNADHTGHSPINILASFIGGSGGNSPGHRILCLEMPIPVYATHQRILRLTEAEREAIYLYYAVRLKPDGTLWTLKERCKALNITLDSMTRRLTRAKQRIQGLPVSDDLQEKDCKAVRYLVHSAI